jgi:hypothetical protein
MGGRDALLGIAAGFGRKGDKATPQARGYECTA